MFLRSLEIKNYRSLEDAKLEGLEHLNVLIGRNNSGKSSLFSALSLLNSMIRGSVDAGHVNRVLTAHEVARSLKLRLIFDARPSDREQFLDFLGASWPGRVTEERREAMLNRWLFSQVAFAFTVPSSDLHRPLL